MAGTQGEQELLGHRKAALGTRDLGTVQAVLGVKTVLTVYGMSGRELYIASSKLALCSPYLGQTTQAE